MKKIAARRASHKKPRSGKTQTKAKAKAKTKTIYRLKNWSAYNQALVNRGRITLWLSEEALSAWYYEGPPQRGAQYSYSDLAIETSLTLGKLLHQPLRQTQGLVQSLLVLMDTDLEAPDYSTLSRRQGALQVVLPVKAKAPGEGLQVVVDSSGLKIYGEGEWRTRGYGQSYRRTWRKLHLSIDVATGEIVAQTLTLAGVDDGSQVKPMLAQIEGQVDRLGGDGAYDTWSVLHTLAYPSTQETPIEAVIPPRRGAQVRKAKRRYRHIEARNQRVRAIDRQGRKKWKRNSGYHPRSLSETGVWRFKGILGPTLRSRKVPNQQVEARIGCRILNRMIHLGKPETYQVEVAA
jgi:hypothetical protein